MTKFLSFRVPFSPEAEWGTPGSSGEPKFRFSPPANWFRPGRPLIRNNFPDTKVFEGDIWKLEEFTYGISNRSWKEKALAFDLVTTCQGMSSNGAGRISAAIRQGIVRRRTSATV